MTYKEAIKLVNKNEGSEFYWKDYCFDEVFSFEDLVLYIKTLEKSDDNDYPCVLNDIEQRLDSCGFDQNKLKSVIKALGLEEHFQILSAR